MNNRKLKHDENFNEFWEESVKIVAAIMRSHLEGNTITLK